MKIDTSSETSVSSVMNYDRDRDTLVPATPIQTNIYTAFKRSFSSLNLNKIVTVIDQDCNIVGFVQNPKPQIVDKLELLFYDVNSNNYIVLFELKSGSDGGDIANQLKFEYFTSLHDPSTTIVRHFKELK